MKRQSPAGRSKKKKSPTRTATHLLAATTPPSPLLSHVRQLGIKWPVPRALRHRVCVRWPGSPGVKLFQVQFAQDGFFVHFPYHPQLTGVLRRGAMPFAIPGASALDTMELGRVTAHQVKYTHHVNGECHFSQDNKIYTAVRNPGRNLLTPDDGNPVFIGEFTGLESFNQAKPSEYDAGVHIDLPRLEVGVNITGRWIRVQPNEIDNAQNPLQWPQRKPDEFCLAIGLAPPAGAPLDGSVLILQVDTGKHLAPLESVFGLAFWGGWEVRLTGLRYVMLKYPYDGPEGLPSIDLQRDEQGRPRQLAKEPLAFIQVGPRGKHRK
jgi:hypothetical protein